MRSISEPNLKITQNNYTIDFNRIFFAITLPLGHSIFDLHPPYRRQLLELGLSEYFFKEADTIFDPSDVFLKGSDNEKRGCWNICPSKGELNVPLNLIKLNRT